MTDKRMSKERLGFLKRAYSVAPPRASPPMTKPKVSKPENEPVAKREVGYSEVVAENQTMEIRRVVVDGGWLYVTTLFRLDYGRFRGPHFFVSTTFVPGRDA